MRRVALSIVVWTAVAWATESLVLVGPIGRAELGSLQRAYPLIVDDYRDGYAYCYTDSEDLEHLAGLPWPHRVLVADLAAHYAVEREMWPAPDYESPWSYFHTYEETVALLEQWAGEYPDICRLVELGLSVEGRRLLSLVVSGNAHLEEYEPEVRLVGTIHGDEIIANEIVLYAAERLLVGYGVEPDVTRLVDGLEIWLQPLVNPDGFVRGTRRNANNVDLNRNFSYQWDPREWYAGPSPFSEPETRALADYSGGREEGLPDEVEDNSFVLGLTFHSGAICVNYVWNYQPERAPDDAHIQTICYDYSDACKLSPYFPPWVDGHGYRDESYMEWVTNGWDWYETHGDLNDWSYGARGCIDTTIEADERKLTDPRDITYLADVNWHAVKSWLEWADVGLHGTVTVAGVGPIPATITVGDRDEAFAYNDPTVFGDYWLPLADGLYDIAFSAAGYEPIVFEGVEVTGRDTPPLDVVFGDSGGTGGLELAARRTGDGVLVLWRSETPYAGFNIHRCDAEGRLLYRLNEKPLPERAVSYLDLDPPSPVARYRLEGLTPAGHRLLFGPVELEVSDEPGGPSVAAIYPNPVGERAVVELVSTGGFVEAAVYDLAGRLVLLLHRGELPPGRHRLELDAGGLSAGVHLLVVKSACSTAVSRFVVSR